MKKIRNFLSDSILCWQIHKEVVFLIYFGLVQYFLEYKEARKMKSFKVCRDTQSFLFSHVHCYIIYNNEIIKPECPTIRKHFNV